MPHSSGALPMIQSLTSHRRSDEAANPPLSNACNTCCFCIEESRGQSGQLSIPVARERRPNSWQRHTTGRPRPKTTRRGKRRREKKLVDRGCANCLAAALALATKTTGAMLDQPHMDMRFLENRRGANSAKHGLSRDGDRRHSRLRRPEDRCIRTTQTEGLSETTQKV